MAPVADIHSDVPKLRLEDCVAGVALHIIRGLAVKKENTAGRLRSFLIPHRCTRGNSPTDLVKVSDPGNVVLPALSQHASRVGDHHGGVPQSAAQPLSLQNRRDHDHVVLLGQLTTGRRRY